MKFPKHKCGLYLEHNAHKDYYKTVEQELSDSRSELEFENEDARQRARDTNELWTLQWYPDTPIGFYKVAAPTLDEVLAFALKQDECGP